MINKDRVVRDRAQYGEGAGKVAIERFYKYNWQGLLSGKAEVFGTTSASGDAVTGEMFETTYDVYDTVGNLRAMTYPSGLTAEFGYGEGGALDCVGANRYHEIHEREQQKEPRTTRTNTNRAPIRKPISPQRRRGHRADRGFSSRKPKAAIVSCRGAENAEKTVGRDSNLRA